MKREERKSKKEELLDYIGSLSSEEVEQVYVEFEPILMRDQRRGEES